MSQLGHYQLGYIETLSHWNQTEDKNIVSFIDFLEHKIIIVHK